MEEALEVVNPSKMQELHVVSPPRPSFNQQTTRQKGTVH